MSAQEGNDDAGSGNDQQDRQDALVGVKNVFNQHWGFGVARNDHQMQLFQMIRFLGKFH